MKLTDKFFSKEEGFSLGVVDDSDRSFLQERSQPSNGNFYESDGNFFALFALNGALYFRWNEKQWAIDSIKNTISYSHNFSKKTTTFSVGNLSVEYPAWWRDDPLFEPNIPELDEQEDYLGYIKAVTKDEELQKHLIDAWSK